MADEQDAGAGGRLQPKGGAGPGGTNNPTKSPRRRRGSVHTERLDQYLAMDAAAAAVAAATSDENDQFTDLDGKAQVAGDQPPSARQAALNAALVLGQTDKSKDSKTAYSYHLADVKRAAGSPQSHPTSAALYSIWRAADSDGNGFLSESEIKSLNSQLRVNWSFDDVWMQVQEMYQGNPDEKSAFISQQGSREIGFGAFVQVYNIRMGAQRRKHRLEVKAQFERMDLDRSGTLDFDEVQKLIKRCKKLLHLLPPDYDPETDWREMTLDAPSASMASKGITFPDFERWWKDRIGLVEADTPVLPEYFTHKLAAVGPALEVPQPLGSTSPKSPLAAHASGLNSGSFSPKKNQRRLARVYTSRKGPELWAFLKPRLRLMVAMKKEWGELRDVYGHAESLFSEPPIPPWIRDPESNFSVVWDLVQIVFLLYVSITVPLRASFAVTVEFMTLTWWFDTLVDIYFILDMVLNFRTAFVNSKGVRETNPKIIAKSYLRGWFAIDFVSCIPVGHISYAIEQAALSEMDASETGGGNDEASPDNLKALKSLRLLKLSKMLRLARLKRIMQKYENLMVVQEYMGIFFMLAIIIFTAHFLTCIWFSVGDDPTAQPLGYYQVGSEGYEENDGLVEVVGWVYLEPWTDPGGTDLVVPTSTKFISSMYYVFNALDGNGNTDMERITAVFAYMMMVMIDGAVAGVMSALLIGMSGNEREITDKLRGIKHWMTAHRVPRMKQSHALNYFSQHFKVQAQWSEAEILADMPPSMRDDFRAHLYGKFLASVPIFRDLSQEILAALCGVVQPMLAVKQQVIFEEGSTGTEMYMLMVGELEVTQNEQRLGFLSDGAFFGEVPILDESTGSEIRTRTITAMTDSKLCFITTDDIKELRDRYPELALRIKRFAKVGKKTRNKAKGLKLQEAARIKRNLSCAPQGSQHSEQTAPVSTDALSKSPISKMFLKDHGKSPLSTKQLGSTANGTLGADQLKMLEEKMTQLITRQVNSLSAQLNQKLDAMTTQQLGIDPVATTAAPAASPTVDLDKVLEDIGFIESETILPGTPSTSLPDHSDGKRFRQP